MSMRRRSSQTGLTLVELMVSLALGLLLVLVATGMLTSARTSFHALDDDVHMQDAARFALDLIARSVRQAAFENWDSEQAPVVAHPELSPNVRGLNARRVSATSEGIATPLSSGVVNGSDVLAIRFFGAGPAATPGGWSGGDATMLNCAGFSVPAPDSQSEAEERRGWSIFYVARSTSGEPELYCKYRGTHAFAATAIVQGVESFQVLYGLDFDGDSIPDRFLHAAQIDALDSAISLAGRSSEQRQAELNRLSNWKRVVAVRVALLVRGRNASRADESVGHHDLFGPDYSELAAAVDPGVRIRESTLPAAERSRLRRVFSTTILLRNRSAGSAA